MRKYLAEVNISFTPTLIADKLYTEISSTASNFLFLFQACNPKYPDYDRTGSICVSENINNTLTRYRWLVSAPTGRDGVTSPMREVDFDTFFTSSKLITLDSVYFQAGSRVQCAARAVNSNGDEGLELSSPIVPISKEEGQCSSFPSLKCVLSPMEMAQHDKQLLAAFCSPNTVLAVPVLTEKLKDKRTFSGGFLGKQNV